MSKNVFLLIKCIFMTHVLAGVMVQLLKVSQKGMLVSQRAL